MRKAYLTGNIGNDPEIFSPQNSEWHCFKFSIANNEESKKENESWVKITSWFDCEYWTKNYDHWSRTLQKGTPVALECRVKQQTWEKDGKKNSRIVFIAEGFPQIIEKPQRANSSPASSAPTDYNSQTKPTEGDRFEDDIPF